MWVQNQNGWRPGSLSCSQLHTLGLIDGGWAAQKAVIQRVIESPHFVLDIEDISDFSVRTRRATCADASLRGETALSFKFRHVHNDDEWCSQQWQWSGGCR